MSISTLLMLSGMVLTLFLPAVLASWLSDSRPLPRHLSALTIGLLLQIIGEMLLVASGRKGWLPYFEAPFVGVRVVQLCLLLRMGGRVMGGKRVAFLAAIFLNLILWLVVGYRLWGRLFLR
jgi:hypothetical protein